VLDDGGVEFINESSGARLRVFAALKHRFVKQARHQTCMHFADCVVLQPFMSQHCPQDRQVSDIYPETCLPIETCYSVVAGITRYAYIAQVNCAAANGQHSDQALFLNNQA